MQKLHEKQEEKEEREQREQALEYAESLNANDYIKPPLTDAGQVDENNMDGLDIDSILKESINEPDS